MLFYLMREIAGRGDMLLPSFLFLWLPVPEMHSLLLCSPGKTVYSHFISQWDILLASGGQFLEAVRRRVSKSVSWTQGLGVFVLLKQS